MAPLDSTGRLYLITGSANGNLSLYGDIENHISKGDTFDFFEPNFSDINYGRFTSVHGADIDGDGKLELVVGNYLGGVALFDGIDTNIVYLPIPYGVSEPTTSPIDLTLFPNPTSNSFWVGLTHSQGEDIASIKVFNTLGQIVQQHQPSVNQPFHKVDLSPAADGMYWVQVRLRDGRSTAVPLLLARH